MKVYLLIVLLSLVSAKVRVFSPGQLITEVNAKYHENFIPSTLANFGNPPYGASIVGRLYYTGNDDENNEACSRLKPINFSGDVIQSHNPLLLVDRGTCPFVVKARHAQDVGASAVIVVDNVIEDVTRIVMSDDGTGGNIFIPTLMIGKSDGDLLKQYLADPSYANLVTLSISFEMNHPDNRVEYDMWLSSDHWLVRSFLHDFAPFATKFTDKTALFTPHYVMWYCTECKRNGYNETAPADCVSSGRYCAPDPDQSGPRTGRDVIMEDLRQICIYQQTTNRNDENPWWKYVSAFNETCTDERFNQDCSEKAMRTAGVNVNDIRNCVTESFQGSRNIEYDDNKLLLNEKQEMIKNGVFFYPSIMINNQTYRGDLEVEEVMEAICAGFETYPDICEDFLPYSRKKKNDKSHSHGGGGGIGAATLVVIIVIAVLILGVVLFFYRRWIRRELNYEMKMQVNSAVSQYFALSDSSGSRDQ